MAARRVAIALSLTTALLTPAGAQAPSLDAALAEFWAASNPKELARAIERVVATGASFDDVYAKLAAGRRYASDVDRGEFSWTSLLASDAPLRTAIVIPRDYDPGRRYPVRVYLHGGVARESADQSARRAPRRRLDCETPCIEVFPTGAIDATWWSAAQVGSIETTLARLKRTYNVDENHVHLMGVSDGGTGVYFFGLRDATPWSVLFPFNGHLGVLGNPAVRADGEFYLGNLVNTPAYIINGGRDPLYPVRAVEPYVELLERAGAPLEFRPQPEAGHDTSWWPGERALVEAFERAHSRDPLPDRLSWQTERTDRYNRFRWLVIDTLDATRSESALEDPNVIERTAPLDFGLRIDSRKDPRRVIEVLPDSDAATMGLRKGDVLVSMDGIAIRTADDIGRAFDGHAVRSPMVFVVERGGQRLQMQIDFPPLPKPPVREEAFPRRKPSGRVDLERHGNEVQARTRGVGAFTLLLSPAVFDFDRPIRVVVNGQVAFDGRVRKDVATLLRWSWRDVDRTMLFAAELKIEVPPRLLLLPLPLAH